MRIEHFVGHTKKEKGRLAAHVRTGTSSQISSAPISEKCELVTLATDEMCMSSSSSCTFLSSFAFSSFSCSTAKGTDGGSSCAVSMETRFRSAVTSGDGGEAGESGGRGKKARSSTGGGCGGVAWSSSSRTTTSAQSGASVTLAWRSWRWILVLVVVGVVGVCIYFVC